jgi:hypothetical protein
VLSLPEMLSEAGGSAKRGGVRNIAKKIKKDNSARLQKGGCRHQPAPPYLPTPYCTLLLLLVSTLTIDSTHLLHELPVLPVIPKATVIDCIGIVPTVMMFVQLGPYLAMKVTLNGWCLHYHHIRLHSHRLSRRPPRERREHCRSNAEHYKCHTQTKTNASDRRHNHLPFLFNSI